MRKILVGWGLFILIMGRTVAANPHLPRDNKKCALCHDSPLFNTPRRLCLKCHKSPQVKSARECLKCHYPHAGSETILLLKKEWIRDQLSHEMINPHNRKNCLKCHEIIPEDKQNLFLKFGGNLNLVCRDCHEIDGCSHPTGIKVPENAPQKNLRLDHRKRIVCTTCHRSNCREDGSIDTVGFSLDKGLVVNTLCYNCHPARLGKNPHISPTKQSNCWFCHFFASPGSKSHNYTLIVDPWLICLQCHPELPHPGNKNHHLRLSSDQKSLAKKLRLDSLGRMTCITCHNPHANPGSECAVRVDCIDCHKDFF